MLTFYNKNSYKKYKKAMENITPYFKTKIEVLPFQLVRIKKALS